MATTNRQRVFIDEYFKCWNASEAARRAGYKGKANVVGPRLLANVSIAAEIKSRLESLQMSSDEVLVRLTEQARGSMEDFINPSRNTLDLKKAQAAKKLHLIKSFKKSTGRTKSIGIELYDAQAALTLIGKHLGLFVDRQEHTGKNGGPIQTQTATVSIYLPDNGRADVPPQPEEDAGSEDH